MSAVEDTAVLRVATVSVPIYRAGSDREWDDDAGPAQWGSGGIAEGEDLPYKVELWDPTKQSVELVLAVTANGSIGYAAYYAATRDYHDRYITLRHKNSIISRWNPPEH